MKKFIALLLIISNTAFATCDWSQIKSLPDGGFEYDKSLHICVGNLVQENKSLTQQVSDLNKAIALKDLALKISDDRAMNWSNTSKDLEDRLQKVDSEEKKNELLYIGLGILATVATGYMTARLIGR